MATLEERIQQYKQKYVEPKSTVTVDKYSDKSANDIIAELRGGVAQSQEIAEYKSSPESKSFLQKFGDVSGGILGLGGLSSKALSFLTKNEQAFGETLGGAAALGGQSRLQEESTQRYKELGDAVLRQLQDPSIPNENKKKIVEMYQESNPEILSEEINPILAKTAKQIYGEGLGVATDIAAFGKYGKALDVTKAKTAGQAFGIGAKKFGLEGAALGASFGASEALQEDKTAGEIAGRATLGGITGGIIGAVVGGLSARSQYLKPEKATKLREKAIEQYKKGLKATKEKYKEKAESVIPELLDNEIWGTHKELLKKAQEGVALAESDYRKLGELKGMVEIDGIFNMIDNEIAKYTQKTGRVTSVSTQKVKALEELKLDLLALDAFDNIVDNKAAQQSLRELAQQYGQELYETRRAQKTIMDNKTLSQVKKVDSAIRALLADANPEYAKINKVYHTNNELAEILNETAQRTGGQKLINMVRSLSFGGGAVTGAVVGGAPGVVIGGFSLTALAEILNSTWWNTFSAVRKNRLAQKLEQQAAKGIGQGIILLARQGIKYANELLRED